MLIGLSGKRQAGKDTVAAALVEDYGFVRVALADTLKDLLVAQDPWVYMRGQHWHLSRMVSAFGWDVIKQSPDVRRLLQKTGAAICAYDTNFFARAAFNKAAAARDVVITDMRFDFELPWLRARGGHLVRVDRVGHVVDDADRSETEADAWDYDVVLHNGGPGVTDPSELASALLAELRALEPRAA